MESIKRDRLRSYHQQVMLGRLRILDLATLSYRRHPELRGKLFPHTRVIASFPEIRQIIDKPDDISVTIDDFLALTQTVHKSVADWRDKRISFFADCVRRQFDIPENIDPLQLAIGQFFQCNRCQRALALPYALGHYCYRTLKDHLDDYDLFADSAYCANLTLAVEARVDAINSLLEACNRDTRTTTVQDMDDLDLRFTCRLCNDFLVLFKELMDWHEAVSPPVSHGYTLSNSSNFRLYMRPKWGATGPRAHGRLSNPLMFPESRMLRELPVISQTQPGCTFGSAATVPQCRVIPKSRYCIMYKRREFLVSSLPSRLAA